MNSAKWFCGAVALLIFFTSQPAEAQREQKLYTDWKAQAADTTLSADEIKQLEKNRILITNETYKQIFTPYLGGNQPLFITSDSLLNVFHVLFEESVMRLEKQQANLLPKILLHIISQLQNKTGQFLSEKKLQNAARERAFIVTGVAMRLMDDSFRLHDWKLDAIIEKEVKKINQASVIESPVFWGKEGFPIDYSRYKPRGFYTKTEKLQRYFRAVAWLQSIPFRLNNDKELLAIVMLGRTLSYNDTSAVSNEFLNMYNGFFYTYKRFIGSGDDWDITTTKNIISEDEKIELSNDKLAQWRQELQKNATNGYRKVEINDQVRFAPDKKGNIIEPNFRILSAYRTPDTVLFQRTTDQTIFKNRQFPCGLEICVALGSDYAKDLLPADEKELLLKTIDKNLALFKNGNSLYFRYLNALRSLLDKPEPDAPDFMTTQAWMIKSCNTVLAGWAQMRHTWALQAKQIVTYACCQMVPPGFVEPEPEFYSRMSSLAKETLDILRSANALSPDYSDIIESIGKLKKYAAGCKNDMELYRKLNNLPKAESRELLIPFQLLISALGTKEQSEAQQSDTMIKWLDDIENDLKKGKFPPLPQYLQCEMNIFTEELGQSWTDFEQICRQLEIIAHKQLRRVDINQDDEYFIMGYGQKIAKLMFYGGNSYVTPQDDAPRITDVYSYADERMTPEYLCVGVDRPRKIYVLYPWKGKPVLCEGAIMPYYEFVSKTRLTDVEWQKLQDSDQRVAIPQWFAPIVSGNALPKPDKIQPCHDN